MAKRMNGEDRLKTIMDAGAKLVGKVGAANVTRKAVAEAAKCAPALVAYYMGSAADAQKAYAKHAKKLGIEPPTKEKIEAIGIKQRAHGPRQNPVVRKRSEKEVKAIKRNVAAKKVVVAKKAAKKLAAPAKKVAKPAVAKVAKPAVAKVAKPAVAKKKPATAVPLAAPVVTTADTGLPPVTAARAPLAAPATIQGV